MNDEYKTIENTGEGYYTEKRSKFLAFAHHVESVDEAKQIIDAYRRKYYDARHCCYAYQIGIGEDMQVRANDDGEPSSTAGKPILGQILSNDLTDILICVVRYYGGVNLGTGGLIVAYRTAAADAITHSKTVVRLVKEKVEFHFTYPMMNGVMRVVKDMKAEIIAQDFNIDCTIVLAIRKSEAPQLRHRLEQLNFE
jgi:uncharacterized YigZ family protein